MGCFNGVCAVSQLHVTYGQEVAVFMLLENKNKKTFCYGNAMYDVCPIPFYGEYNDYGAVENCNGFGLPIVLGAIKSKLYEFGQGPNSSHDTPVNKANFNIGMLFEADHEDRLGIQQSRTWDQDEYDHRELIGQRDKSEAGLSLSQQFELDRHASKIKKEDTFRRVTHVIIHGKVFKDILENWFVEYYVGDSKGTTGYENDYATLCFKDIIDSIPEYINTLKKQAEADKAVNSEDPVSAHLAKMLRRFGHERKWDDPNLATKWLDQFNSGYESNSFGLVDVKEKIADYTDAEDWENLTLFVKEALTGIWINSFMGRVNKLWSKQVSGGQGSEPEGFLFLNKSVKEVLDAEKREYDEENAEDEEDEE